jgi:methyl-accepting chemotaxis protein
MKQRWNGLNLTTKMLTVMLFCIVGTMVGLASWLSSQMRGDTFDLVRGRSIVIQRQIEVTRAYISSEYVGKIKHSGEGKIKIGQEHSAPDVVPFPATATREMAEILAKEGIFNARVISQTPLNPANRPAPGFEERAIKVLASGETEFSTVEPVNGVMTFRRMTPDIIQNQACIGCHTDKKMGDMVGAVSVAIPLTTAMDRVDHNVNMLYGATGFSALLMGLVLFQSLRSQVIQPIRQLQIAVQSLTHGDLAARTTVTTRDEVGNLAQAFNEMGEKLQQASSDQQLLVSTLNNAEANLLMCDRNLVVTYINEGAMKTFRAMEAEIKKYLPHFDSGTLVGTCLDEFHKDAQRVRRILDNPKAMPHRADIQLGPFTLDVNVKAIIDANGGYAGNSFEWLNVTERRVTEKTVLRMQSGLENAGTNFMIADEQENIIFVNKIALAYLKKVETELRQYLPGFEADKVIGGSIHRYHKDPQIIKNILAGLKAGDVRHGEITPGPFIFVHQTRAVFDSKGQKLAYVVEWRDVTAERKAQMEIEKLIKGAAAGQLSERINADQLEGAYKLMSQNVNQLMEAVAVPLHEAQAVLSALAASDMTQQMTGTYEGEFELMKTSLNVAIANLTTTLSTVRTAAESVSTGAEQITKGNEDLSQRTSEQASSLEETSSAMEEMTSTVKQNADNAKQANQLAIAARDVAEKGGAVTAKAIDAMSEINKSSKKIADIITVIDEIAFQTNLLALNAAVEAARAGEHGRGFAVVAAEVRNLAQRSATAAKEIKGLINESVQRVTDGSELVDQSGKTLTEIVGSVKRVTDIIAEIAAASQEQASGIDQVNKAIMQMDETTQQNAALVEEATSASQSMKEQAKELMNQVAAFKLTQTGQEPQQRSGAVAHKPTLSSGPMKKPLLKNPVASPAPVLGSAAMASGNGKDRRQTDSEFEEF